MIAPVTGNEVRIALVEETLDVTKRVVETARVRVSTFVDDEPVHLSETLRRESVEVERVPFDIAVDVAPQVREDGDYLIIPVIEERPVVIRQLFLVEEIRVRRTAAIVPVEIAETRRVMRAEIERTPISRIAGDD